MATYYALGGYPTLRRGSTGEYVRLVQQKLGVKVDGIYGSVTESAVKTFQRNKGLQVDGIVGPKTWAALGFGGNGGGGGDATNPKGNNQVDNSTSSGKAINTVVTGPLNMIIGGVLLYGLFKIYMKIF